MKEKTELFFRNREELRQWFNKNYKTSKSFYMIFYKKNTNKECIDYNDALEEALCFGWIDSILKKKDEERYIRQFSRRNPKSAWSERNVKIMQRLIKEKLVKKEIIDEFKKAKKNGQFESNETKNMTIEVPEYMRTRLTKHKKANDNFNKLYKQEKQAFIYFITEAKKATTRKKRLDEMIRKLEQGWRMPYHRPK